MKKTFSLFRAAAALCAGALALCLAGCSGDLHDAEYKPVDISGGEGGTYYLVGSMQGWDANDPIALSDNGDGTYSVTFTADDAAVSFALIPTPGSWDGQITGDLMQGGTLLDGVTYEAADNGFGGYNASFTGLTSGSSYKMTVTPEADGTLTLDLASGTAAVEAAPVPYYLDGLYLVGACFTTDGGTNQWSFSTHNLIRGASVEKKTGIVTYTVDITATQENGKMGINDCDWANKQLGGGITVTAGADSPTALDGEADNFNVEGLTEGGAYRVEITTSPEKVVSVRIYAIAKYTLNFKATGLEEGTEVYIDGSPWGSSWKACWPISGWGGDYDTAKTDYPDDFATADDQGVAEFETALSFVGMPGETVSYAVKLVSCTSDSADPVLQTADLPFDVTIADGTFLVTIDVTNGKATAELQSN